MKRDALKIASKIAAGVQEMGADHSGVVERVVEKLAPVLRGRVRAAYLLGWRAEGYSLKGDYDIAVLMQGAIVSTSWASYRSSSQRPSERARAVLPL